LPCLATCGSVDPVALSPPGGGGPKNFARGQKRNHLDTPADPTGSTGRFVPGVLTRIVLEGEVWIATLPEDLDRGMRGASLIESRLE